MQCLQKLLAKQWFQVEYLKTVLLLESVIPKKSKIKKKTKALKVGGFLEKIE